VYIKSENGLEDVKINHHSMCVVHVHVKLVLKALNEQRLVTPKPFSIQVLDSKNDLCCLLEKNGEMDGQV
jgi:hypothetical protein